MCVCNFNYFWINEWWIFHLWTNSYIVIKHNKTSSQHPWGSWRPSVPTATEWASPDVDFGWKIYKATPKEMILVMENPWKSSENHGWFGGSPILGPPPYSMGYSAGIFSEVCHGKYTVSNLRYNQPLDVIVGCIWHGNWPSSSGHLK
jgi:hypothetical protein